jgi:hypothetical protein
LLSRVKIASPILNGTLFKKKKKNEENKYKKLKKNNYATICWVKIQTKN